MLVVNCRTNIGGANIAGMNNALQMDDNSSYSITLMVFFPGYGSCEQGLKTVT